MSMLRDIFSRWGLCESSKDLERRTALIDKIIKRSKEVIDIRDKTGTEFYAECIGTLLSSLSHNDLEKLIKNNVVICFDSRLSEIKNPDDTDIDTDIEHEIVAALYSVGEYNILSICDGAYMGYMETGVISNVVSCSLPDRGVNPMFGTVSYLDTDDLKWNTVTGISSIVENNPWLINPPAIKDIPVKPRLNPDILRP